MKDKTVIVDAVEPVSKGFLSINRYALRHSTPDGGMSNPVYREVMERGNAAAAIIYDKTLDSVLLVEEFRIGQMASGVYGDDGWSIGPIAGVVEAGEDGLKTVIREAREEVGIVIPDDADFEGPLRYFSSPGGTSEILDIYVIYADITKCDPALIDNDEDEYTVPVVMTVDELRDHVASNITTASLVAGLMMLNNIKRFEEMSDAP